MAKKAAANTTKKKTNNPAPKPTLGYVEVLGQLPPIIDTLGRILAGLAAILAAGALGLFDYAVDGFVGLGNEVANAWKKMCDRGGVNVGKGYWKEWDGLYPPHSQQYHEINRYKQEQADAKKKDKVKTSSTSNTASDPGDPNNKDKDKNKGSNKTPMTNKEATEAANKLGYKDTNQYSHGQKVFRKGNRYITPDVDAHSGGVWKMADSIKNLGSKSTRMGTYDANLNWIAP
ncbi:MULTISPECIES: toxin C-terminal domain-containing protein [unclassified Breznakia]|uniref:toxin C-terminal domain-containing protein n=1 Tax=unclassified Breznakia TaxID=2623764 RepID=UPI0024065FEC|nr:MULTISPECIES: toxin C-terminal domain-containing protein [unclassified Breznakia]